MIMQSKPGECGFNKSRFVKEQEPKVLLSNLAIKTPLSKITLLTFCFNCNSIECIRMNEIIIKFLLACEKFMPEMHLKEPGFTYSACGIEKFMQTGNTDFICKNELGKACFQHNMVYGKSKDLAKRTQSDKVLREKGLKIASDPKYDGYQRGLVAMVYKFFHKKSSKGGVETEPNYQLANKLHGQIIRRFKRRKVYSSFRDNILGVDLADMQSLSKYKKGIKYLLCAIDLFSKYARVVPVKDKREISIVNTFQKIMLSGRKPNKISVDQSGEFYNKLLGGF